MTSSHNLQRLTVSFDGPSLVAHAGLLLPATLGERLGLRQLIDRLKGGKRVSNNSGRPRIEGGGDRPPGREGRRRAPGLTPGLGGEAEYARQPAAA